jgi:predicted dehydrogenase
VDALRLGLLSTAAINRQILGGARETDRVEIVAVASRDRARADAYAAEHGIGRAHGSYDDLLADDGVDAVYIGLPNGMHHAWTMRALAAGKHVLCEKPFTRRSAEAEEAFAAAEDAGLVLMEAFMYRHHPQTTIVRDLVTGGAIGRLMAVRATFSFQLEDLTDIRAIAELDGGALMDVGCYCISGIRLLAGEPERVFGEQVTGSTGVDMAFHGTLRCADDVVAQFEASFRAPRRQWLEAVGDEGVLTVEAPWRIDWGGAVRLAQRDGETVSAGAVVDVPEANSYRVELENLADAVAGRAPQLLARADAVGQARVIEGLYRSAAEGRAIDLGAAPESGAGARA